MLGWIYIWKDEESNLHQVKVRFGNLWFYLLIQRPSTLPLEEYILKYGKIVDNRCSREERWKNFREPDYKDYKDIDIHKLSRIIFICAPKEERKEREFEWKGLESYYWRRRILSKEVEIELKWHPNCFDIEIPSLDLTFDIWKRLPRRVNKRKPKNVIRWFESATETRNTKIYSAQSLGRFRASLPSLIWWLGDERGETLLDEMFGEM